MKKISASPVGLLFPSNYLDAEDADARFEICKACDRLLHATNTCKECGCFMKAKVKLKDAACPLGKW